jgi:hypothetical protein
METCSRSAVRSGSRVRRVASILTLGAILVWTASLAAQTFSTPRGTVSNVRFARVGTTFTITYDLASTDDSAIFKVTLEVSFDKGQTFSFKPAAVSGDIGEGVKPGKDKKIVWQTSKDTENQEFDQFRFMPVVLSGIAKPIPGTLAVTTSPAGATVVVDGQPSGTTPATINLPSGKHGVAISRTGYAEVREEVEIEAGKTKTLDRRLTARADLPGGVVDLRGQWSGSYPGTMPAQLTIDRQDGQTFSGTLSVTTMAGKETSELQVEGKISGQAVELRELKVLSLGAAPRWTLGSATGVLQADTRRMSGSGTDGRSSYQWDFTRPDAPTGGSAGPAARALDLRGSWQGTYAGAAAQLTIDRQDGPVFTGVLRLTTASGKEPSEVQIEARVSGQTVDFREVKLVKLGAARGWSLGSGSGTVQPNGQFIGTGKDSSHSYQWSFTRR